MTKIQVRCASNINTNASVKAFDPVNTSGIITLLKATISGDTNGRYDIQDGSGGTVIASVWLLANTTAVALDLTAPNGVAGEIGSQGKALVNSLYMVGPTSSHASITAVTAETGF